MRSVERVIETFHSAVIATQSKQKSWLCTHICQPTHPSTVILCHHTLKMYSIMLLTEYGCASVCQPLIAFMEERSAKEGENWCTVKNYLRDTLNDWNNYRTSMTHLWKLNALERGQCPVVLVVLGPWYSCVCVCVKGVFTCLMWVCVSQPRPTFLSVCECVQMAPFVSCVYKSFVCVCV